MAHATFMPVIIEILEEDYTLEQIYSGIREERIYGQTGDFILNNRIIGRRQDHYRKQVIL